MDSIVFYQPPSTRSTPPRGESVGSGNACTSKSASETSQRNEFKDILSNVLNDRDLIEVRDITALDLGESDLPLHHASKDDGNSCANCEDNDNDQDFPSVEEILWRGISNNGSPSPKRTPKRLDKEIWTGDSQDEPIVLDDLNGTGLESECGRYIVSRAGVEVNPPFSPETYSDLLPEFGAFIENVGNKDIKNNTCSLSSEQRRSQFNISTFKTSLTFSTSISNLSSSTAYSYHNGLSSKPGEQTCEGNGGDYEHPSSDSPDLKDKEDLWDGMRAKAEVKERDSNNDGDKDNTPPKLLDSEVRNEDNLIVIHDTDEETNTDTNDNCHHLSKKHKRLAVTPKTSSAAPKFRYPPGWVRKHRDECANPNWGETVDSQDNSYVVQNNNDVSDDGTDKEQDRDQASPTTPPTSVTDSVTECFTLHENKVDSASNISPSRRNILLSSADGKKKDERKDKETGTNDEKESESDADKYKTPSPRSTKKRSLPFVEDKLRVKRRIKRRPFSSRLSSDEHIETKDESDISSYTSVKPHHVLNLPSSFHSTDFDENTSEDATECKDEQSNKLLISRTAVIYEQQRWEGKIVGERNAKQERGRPRKEYRVHWEDSWIDGAHLTAPGLIQD